MIVALALLALAVVVGGIALAFSDRGLPGELIAIGSAAAGAIAGILSHTSTNDPQQVTVVNQGPAEAVPVAETPAKPARRRKAENGSTLVEVLVVVLAVAGVLILMGRP